MCGQHGHRPAERNDREEVAAAIKRLKLKNHTEMLTQEDEAFITEMYEAFNEEDIEDEDNLNEDDECAAEEDEIIYLAEEDLRDMAANLANNAFEHSKNIEEPLEGLLMLATGSAAPDEQKQFQGIRIDTCANRTSVIGEGQYLAYCKKLGLKPALRIDASRSVKGVRGTQKGIGAARIDIPFKCLKITISVLFLILKGEIPGLLSMRDMITNGLELSLQKATISFAGLHKDLELKNIFLVHNWNPDDMSYALYTESELRKIHRNFGHPSVNAMGNLLRRASQAEIDGTTRHCLKKITEQCRICQVHAAKPRRFKLKMGPRNYDSTTRYRFTRCSSVGSPFVTSLTKRPTSQLPDS